jgi:hypothetical protein
MGPALVTIKEPVLSNKNKHHVVSHGINEYVSTGRWSSAATGYTYHWYLGSNASKAQQRANTKSPRETKGRPSR